MKLGIIGSRSFNDYNKAKKVFKNFFQQHTKIIVSGDCPSGGDLMGKKLAEEFDIEYEGYPADWDQYSKSAGFIRNGKIVDNSDMILAFYDGVSKGTLDTLNKAKQKKRSVFVIYY